jgi:uncharacterized HhH-GPD family protein
MPSELPFTEDADANRLLAANPLALLIGMLLDQQFPMERAFLSPHILAQRIDGPLDAANVAAIDADELVAAFRGPPALHRFPGSMAERCQAMCSLIVDEYGGEPARIWLEAADGNDLVKRLEALPGFGKTKARIFVGIVGKRLGKGPRGWENAAANWPSIADIDSFDKIYELREQKRAMKAAGKKPQ